MSAQPSGSSSGPTDDRDTRPTAAATGQHRAAVDAEEPTIGRLVADSSKHVSTLVRSEIELAKSELKVSVKAGGIGAALLAVAVFLLVLGVIMLSAAFAFALVRWFDIGADWAFLIVFGAYLLVALVLMLLAVSRFKKVSAPQRTIDTTKETVAALKRR